MAVFGFRKTHKSPPESKPVRRGEVSPNSFSGRSPFSSSSDTLGTPKGSDKSKKREMPYPGKGHDGDGVDWAFDDEPEVDYSNFEFFKVINDPCTTIRRALPLY